MAYLQKEPILGASAIAAQLKRMGTRRATCRAARRCGANLALLDEIG